MKFIVERTSDYAGETAPCVGAKEEIIICRWLNGREFPKKRWVIEIDSFEELMKLKEENGQLIIGEEYIGQDRYQKIEIYDTYREG